MEVLSLLSQNEKCTYVLWKQRHICTGSKVINSWIYMPHQGDRKSLQEIKIMLVGLLWWLSGKEPVCQFRRPRFDPWSRRIPQSGWGHTPHYWTCTLELRRCNHWSPQILKLCSTMREATWMRSPHSTTGEWLLLAATREKPVQQWRPSISKNFKNVKKIFKKMMLVKQMGLGKGAQAEGTHVQRLHITAEYHVLV